MTKPREKTREELQAEIEDRKKKIRQLENREKMLRQKLLCFISNSLLQVLVVVAIFSDGYKLADISGEQIFIYFNCYLFKFLSIHPCIWLSILK